VEKDYENIDDIDDLTDGELRALVRDRLNEQLAFDPNDVDVAVRDGVVQLSGRVGTEEEFRIVERVVTDMVGIKRVRNDMVVDPIRRAESPTPIDEHLVDEELHEGILLGDRPRPEDPEADIERDSMEPTRRADAGRCIRAGFASQRDERRSLGRLPAPGIIAPEEIRERGRHQRSPLRKLEQCRALLLPDAFRFPRRIATVVRTGAMRKMSRPSGRVRGPTITATRTSAM
jgi:hypothetical protein